MEPKQVFAVRQQKETAAGAVYAPYLPPRKHLLFTAGLGLVLGNLYSVDY